MNLFYCMGGGYGHLHRVRTFINQFQITPFQIVTNNPLASRLFSVDAILFVHGTSASALKSSIQSIFELPHKALYVDAFPAGLFGELNEMKTEKRYYLARRLRWQVYEKFVQASAVPFECTYIMESLEPAHQTFVAHHSRSAVEISLQYPAPAHIPHELIPSNKQIWLIVHAFIQEEVETLVRYAKEVAHLEKQSPAFVLISDQVVADEDVISLSYFPALDWFPLAERIFTGGGFNVMSEAKGFEEKITAIPFPRKYDDQRWRIARFSSPMDTRVGI